MIELDLNGQKLRLHETDLAWLRGAAGNAASRSSSASDLAGRLAAVTVGQHRLVFVRAEVRALLNVLKTATEIPPGLSELNQLARQMFANESSRA